MPCEIHWWFWAAFSLFSFCFSHLIFNNNWQSFLCWDAIIKFSAVDGVPLAGIWLGTECRQQLFFALCYFSDFQFPHYCCYLPAMQMRWTSGINTSCDGVMVGHWSKIGQHPTWCRVLSEGLNSSITSVWGDIEEKKNMSASKAWWPLWSNQKHKHLEAFLVYNFPQAFITE